MHHYIYHCSFCIQPILVIKFDSISGGDADGFVRVSSQLQEFFVVKSAERNMKCKSKTNKEVKVLLTSITLQGINISHLGKRKIIFKMDFSGGYVNSLEDNYQNSWSQNRFSKLSRAASPGDGIFVG